MLVMQNWVVGIGIYVDNFRGTATSFSKIDLEHVVNYFKREEKPFYSLPTRPKGIEVS